MNFVKNLFLRFRNSAPVNPVRNGNRGPVNNRIEIGADYDAYLCSPSFMDEQRAKERSRHLVLYFFLLEAFILGGGLACLIIWKAVQP